MAIDQVTSGLIKDAAVTTAKVADDAVTAAKIPTGAVVADIAAGGITTAKLADDAVTAAKLGPGAVDTTALGADAIDGTKIADNAVNSEHVTAGAIDTAHIGNDQVTGAKIENDPTIAGSLTVAGDIIPSTPFSHRNMIINGSMNVCQRETSAINQGYKTLDKWRNFRTGFAGEITFSQDADGPPGFKNCMKLTNAADEATVSAADIGYFNQRIEAKNCQRLGYGAAGAKVSTLSFWVKSTITGTGCVYIQIEDHSYRQWSGSYTISASNTWEYKTLTIPANTASTINNDTGNGLDINWVLLAGSNFTGGGALSSSWEADTANKRAYGQTNFFAGGTGKIFKITGVQLEVGAATPYEHQEYAEELRRCQRYMQKYSYFMCPGFWNGSQNARAYFTHHVPMRAMPTLAEVNGSGSAGGACSPYNYTHTTSGASVLSYSNNTSYISRSGFSGGSDMKILNLLFQNYDVWFEADL